MSEPTAEQLAAELKAELNLCDCPHVAKNDCDGCFVELIAKKYFARALAAAHQAGREEAKQTAVGAMETCVDRWRKNDEHEWAFAGSAMADAVIASLDPAPPVRAAQPTPTKEN